MKTIQVYDGDGCDPYDRDLSNLTGINAIRVLIECDQYQSRPDVRRPGFYYIDCGFKGDGSSAHVSVYLGKMLIFIKQVVQLTVKTPHGTPFEFWPFKLIDVFREPGTANLSMHLEALS